MIGEAAALAAAVCWAIGSHLFGRIGRGGVPAGAMNLGKCATATVLFAIAVTVGSGRLLPQAPSGALWLLAGSGVIGLALGDTAYFGAIVTIGVRRALLLLSTAPVYAAIGGAVFLDEVVTPRDAAAIAAVLAGVALVITDRTGASLPPSHAAPGSPTSPAPAAARPAPLTGILLGVAAGVGQATASLMSRRAMQLGVSARDASFVRMAAAMVGIFALAAMLGQVDRWTRPLRTGRTLAAVSGSAFVGTFVGIWLAQFAIGRATSTAVATTLLATSPIFALPIGHWLGGEPVGARAVAGTLVACAGLSALTLM
jgi:drug/metabolite transporter (DMT)-like permease